MVLLLAALVSGVVGIPGLLRPLESETREKKSLDGLWEFLTDPNGVGFTQKWYEKSLKQVGQTILMPVPASYNDLTQDIRIRDYVGYVWYELDNVFVPSGFFQGKKILLHFSSVHYNASVYVNGVFVVSHEGGHLPFQADITSIAQQGRPLRITVAVDNTLTTTTLPPGSVSVNAAGVKVMNGQFDFFNYAGIHRSVVLYATPTTKIEDITTSASYKGTNGVFDYSIISSGGDTVLVNIVDQDGKVVGSSKTSGSGTFSGTITVPNVNLWWPYTMSQNPAYLYTVEVILSNKSTTSDIYRLSVGFRTVQVTPTQFLINGQPFYFHGVAKHEDSDLRGRGFDWSVVVKDFNLLKWLNANSFRTSHYPYADEILDMTDRVGIVVIDECPGVGIQAKNMGAASLSHHLTVLNELHRRDKNRPSAMVWSVANEPSSDAPEADAYFKSVIGHMKSLDSSRPVIFVSDKNFDNDKAVQYSDFIAINRYYGWYSNTGQPEIIKDSMQNNIIGWHGKYNKPVLITEYGADTVPGLHRSPSFIFTEEFQVEFSQQYHLAFDATKDKGCIGEMVWNFADFMTDRAINRVVGNKKGLFTRDRQPKQAAHTLRARYGALGLLQPQCSASLLEVQQHGCQAQNPTNTLKAWVASLPEREKKYLMLNLDNEVGKENLASMLRAEL